MITLQSPDLSACAFARKLLIQNPKRNMNLVLGASVWDMSGQDITALWEESLQDILRDKTKFGRIGILYDHHNIRAEKWANAIGKKTYKYKPQSKKRSLKIPEFHLFPTQALSHLANEGMADTVEFRRLARKEIRKAKHANIDTLFLLDPILGEDKTRKILQHITGKQMQIQTVLDNWNIKSDEKEKEQTLVIKSSYSSDWTHERAESILQQKLKQINSSGAMCGGGCCTSYDQSSGNISINCS